MRRHDDAAIKKKVKDEFKVGTLLNLAAAVDTTEGAVARALYERVIDSGAHPNELALMQTLQINESANHVELKSTTWIAILLPYGWLFKTTTQVGACTLSLFRAVYPERFDILGLTDLLRHVKVGL